MGYKEEIRDLENKLAMLEYEKSEIFTKLQKADSGGKSVTEWYDAAGDHFHVRESYRGPSKEFSNLAERLVKVEKEIKETREKLRKAKEMAPIREQEEQEIQKQKEKEKQKEQEEAVKQKKREARERKNTVETLKGVYKRDVPRSERISLALQGRRPKWKEIKKLPIEELRFLKKASYTSESSKQNIDTRDEQIEEDIRLISESRVERSAKDKWSPFKYAESRRKEYFLKLLRVRAFLEEEKKKNEDEESLGKHGRTNF